MQRVWDCDFSYFTVLIIHTSYVHVISHKMDLQKIRDKMKDRNKQDQRPLILNANWSMVIQSGRGLPQKRDLGKKATQKELLKNYIKDRSERDESKFIAG